MLNMKQFVAFGIIALNVVTLAACASGNKRQMAGQQPEERVVERTYEQPGQIGKTEQEKGPEVPYEERKKIIKSETKTDTENLPTIKETTVKADINRMDTKDFVALGMSRDAAESLVQYRKQHGDFKSIDDLNQVPGINQTWINQNRDKLSATG